MTSGGTPSGSSSTLSLRQITPAGGAPTDLAMPPEGVDAASSLVAVGLSCWDL